MQHSWKLQNCDSDSDSSWSSKSSSQSLNGNCDGTLTKCVQDFKDLIESEAAIFSACNMMIEQANDLYGDCKEKGLLHLKDYHEMCDLIDKALRNPPPYNDSDLVAFPINSILGYTMCTPAGCTFYASKVVNKHFKAILRHWGRYLSSAESLDAFKPIEEGGCGWTSPEALEKLGMDQFEQPDASALGWGFKSWNDWFIRKFKVGQRSVASPEDSGIIVSACESTPVEIQKDVQLRSHFWLKQQPYSLSFMLGSDEIAEPFIGGEVYQAYLSAFNYHRWHSPISGVITDAKVIPGSYFACCPNVGFDTEPPNLSQPYIANIAARAVFIIKADDVRIGDMAFVAIGIAESSSNKITTSVGQHVNKGEELGYFQYGGSTHCLVFKKGVIGSWFENTSRKDVIKLGAAIASVCKYKKVERRTNEEMVAREKEQTVEPRSRIIIASN